MGATAQDVHVDKVLTEFAMGYTPMGQIADQIFPVVTVDKQTDIYLEADRGRMLRRQKTRRTPGTEARRVERDFGSATYRCQNYALKDYITVEDKANMDPGMIFSKAENKAKLLLNDLFQDWEIRVLDMVFNTSNVGSSAAVSSAWNGAGDPLGDIHTAIDNVRYANGVPTTQMTVCFGPEAWDSFRRDSGIRNIIFGTNNGGGYPNEAQVKTLLNVKRVLIAGAFENSTEEGQTESLNTIAGDNVLAYYAPDAPSIDEPSFGYSIRWQQANLPAPLVIERHPYNSRTHSEEIEAGYYQDEKITGASYGFMLTSVNSST